MIVSTGRGRLRFQHLQKCVTRTVPYKAQTPLLETSNFTRGYLPRLFPPYPRVGTALLYDIEIALLAGELLN